MIFLIYCKTLYHAQNIVKKLKRYMGQPNEFQLKMVLQLQHKNSDNFAVPNQVGYTIFKLVSLQ